MAYSKALAITKSDTANFPTWANGGFCDAIHVGGAGTVTAVLQDDTAVQFTCAAGDILPVKAKRVNNTGTAVTLMVALYL